MIILEAHNDDVYSDSISSKIFNASIFFWKRFFFFWSARSIHGRKVVLFKNFQASSRV